MVFASALTQVVEHLKHPASRKSAGEDGGGYTRESVLAPTDHAMARDLTHHFHC